MLIHHASSVNHTVKRAVCKQQLAENDAYRAATGKDAHALFADPLFLSETGPDLHLQPGSPAIDSGETLAEAGDVDFDGRSRTQNGATDIGAYEGTLVLNKFVYLALVAVN